MTPNDPIDLLDLLRQCRPIVRLHLAEYYTCQEIEPNDPQALRLQAEIDRLTALLENITAVLGPEVENP